MGKLVTGGDNTSDDFIRGRPGRGRKIKPISVMKSKINTVNEATESDRTESENSRGVTDPYKIEPKAELKTVVIHPAPDQQSSDASQTRRRRRGRKILDDQKSNSS